MHNLPREVVCHSEVVLMSFSKFKSSGVTTSAHGTRAFEPLTQSLLAFTLPSCQDVLDEIGPAGFCAPIPDNQCRFIFENMVSALHCMHSHGYGEHVPAGAANAQLGCS